MALIKEHKPKFQGKRRKMALGRLSFYFLVVCTRAKNNLRLGKREDDP